MAVFRVEKTRDYTTMANYHFKDKRLSLKAKGLLSLILSLPDDWKFSVKGLAALNSDGVDAVRSGLKELERSGFVTRKRLRNELGQVKDTEYTVHEKPVRDFPTQANPVQANPAQGNPTLLNTNESIDLDNKDILSNFSTNQSIGTDRTDEAHERQNEEKDVGAQMSEKERYRLARKKVIKENIDYETLVFDRPLDRERIDEMIEVMQDSFFIMADEIRIGDRKIPKGLVMAQMMKLRRSHIEYALERLDENTGEIRNIKQYLLAVLYNAPATMHSYYAAKVNHDMFGEK